MRFMFWFVCVFFAKARALAETYVPPPGTLCFLRRTPRCCKTRTRAHRHAESGSSACHWQVPRGAPRRRPCQVCRTICPILLQGSRRRTQVLHGRRDRQLSRRRKGLGSCVTFLTKLTSSFIVQLVEHKTKARNKSAKFESYLHLHLHLHLHCTMRCTQHAPAPSIPIVRSFVCKSWLRSGR